MFFKIGILKKFENFTEKHLCWSLFLIKLQDFRRCVQVNVGPCSLLACKPYMSSRVNIEQKEPKLFDDIAPG